MTRTVWNDALQETIINPNADELPPQHLGWDGRLNGPVDNPVSSCMSCHATAQYPPVAQHPSFDRTLKWNPDKPEEWAAWFRNLECGEVFDPTARGADGKATPYSSDYSLQLSMGIDHFHEFQAWKKASGGGYFAPDLVERSPDEAVDKDILSEPAGESDGSGI